MIFQFAKIQTLTELAAENRFTIREMFRDEWKVAGQLYFDSFDDLYTFCRKKHEYTDFLFSASYYKPMSYAIPVNFLVSMDVKLDEENISKLGDELTIVGVADLVKTLPWRIDIARRRFSRLVINKATIGHIDAMNFCYILSAFGTIVKEIQLSTDSFWWARQQIKQKYFIIYCIVHYTSSDLRLVNLHEFDMEVTNVRIQPLISILNRRNVVVNMN